ncbi:hypothetical protein OC846_003117, partial [Tilletia horrida]
MHKANKPNAPVSTLSSKLQGLKFMQRGNNAASAPASSASPSTDQNDSRAKISLASASSSSSANSSALKGNSFAPLVAPGSSSVQQQPGVRAQQPAAIAQQRTDGTEDGNEEHWVIASKSIPAQGTDAGSSETTAAAYQGLAWNDWLISQDQSRGASRKGKRKTPDDPEDDDEEEEDEDSREAAQLEQDRQSEGTFKNADDSAAAAAAAAAPPSGRRKFGAWAPRKKRKSEEDADRVEEIVSGKKIKEA